MGRMDALTHWLVGLHRGRIRKLYQAPDHFGTSQDQYLGVAHRCWGGCQAVTVPDQR